MQSVVRASGGDYSGLDSGSAPPPRSASPAPPRGTLRGPSARLSGPRGRPVVSWPPSLALRSSPPTSAAYPTSYYPRPSGALRSHPRGCVMRTSLARVFGFEYSARCRSPFSALADTPNSDKPRLQNPRECHAQHRPRPRRNPKEITVLVLTNEDAEENARHRNDEKDPAQDPEEGTAHAAPALSLMASLLRPHGPWGASYSYPSPLRPRAYAGGGKHAASENKWTGAKALRSHPRGCVICVMRGRATRDEDPPASRAWGGGSGCRALP
jgi:hypothetical protein